MSCVFFIFSNDNIAAAFIIDVEFIFGPSSEESLESLVISNGNNDNPDNAVDDVVEKEGTDGDNTRTLPLPHRLLLLSNVCCVVSYRVKDDEGNSVCLVVVIVENPLQYSTDKKSSTARNSISIIFILDVVVVLGVASINILVENQQSYEGLLA